MEAVQNSLFGEIAPTVVKSRKEILREKNQRAQRNVAEKQSPIWKAAVIEYAEKYFLPGKPEIFLAENLRESYAVYARQYGKPPTIQPKSFNGIMNELVRRKSIERREPERREINGVFATSYLSLI